MVSSGLVVSLSPWVQGFVQTLHVSDHPDRRPEPGASVRCRLLRADHGTDPPKLWLTCRRALLSSRRPIVSSYEEAVSGMVTDGIVVQVTSKGLLVSLYNNVKVLEYFLYVWYYFDPEACLCSSIVPYCFQLFELLYISSLLNNYLQGVNLV